MANQAGTKPTPTPTPSPAPPNHNQGPLTLEDMDDLWLTHLAQARKDDDAVERAMEAVRAVKKVRTRNRNDCRTDGFPLAQLDEILADEELPLSDVRLREEKRSRMRGLAGQPGGEVGEQLDMVTNLERDTADWRALGYMRGIRGVAIDVAKEKIPGDMVQTVMEGWNDGQARLGQAFATKERLEGPPPSAPQPPATGAETQAGEPEKEPEPA